MSRRRKTCIFILCLLLGAVVVGLDHSCASRKHRHPLQSADSAISCSYDIKKYHCKTFTVVNVVDGDTIDIDIPDGNYNHTRIRLWGVDTPETKSPDTPTMYFGEEASSFTKKLTLNKKVRLFLASDKTRGKYGRLLAYVRLPDDRFLNEIFISQGFGYADLRFEHSFYNKYKQLDSVARNQKKGLWKKVKREQLPEWLQRKKPKLLLRK